MSSTKRHIAGIDSLPPMLLLLPPIVVTLMLWAGSSNPVEPFAVVCAFILLTIPWGSFLLWRRHGGVGIPLFAMLSMMYWIFFVPTLFFGTRTLMLSRPIPVSEEGVTQTLAMVVIAVFSLWCGIRFPMQASFQGRLPSIPPTQANLTYIRFVAMAGSLSALFPQSVYLLGVDARSIMIILETIVPTVAFVILLDRYLTGKSAMADRSVICIFMFVRVATGLAAGWLGPLVGLGITVAGLYVYRSRKVPWKYVVLTLCAVLFLQVGKTAYRENFWGKESDAGVIEKVTFWISASASQWISPDQSEGPASRGELASQTLERASLLSQVGHVVEVTPAQVPFQMGSTYSYMAVTLIPRFLWPDKPTMSEANRFYQIAYGLSDRRTVETTSISVGCMAEAFINFGWFGIVGIMFLIGVLLRTYERTFFGTGSNGYFVAMGLVLLPGFIAIESQFAQYFSGVLQQFAMMLLVFLPIVKRQSDSASQARDTSPQYRVRVAVTPLEP